MRSSASIADKSGRETGTVGRYSAALLWDVLNDQIDWEEIVESNFRLRATTIPYILTYSPIMLLHTVDTELMPSLQASHLEKGPLDA